MRVSIAGTRRSGRSAAQIFQSTSERRTGKCVTTAGSCGRSLGGVLVIRRGLVRVMALKGRGSLEPAGPVTRRGRLALDRPVVHQSLANDTARIVLPRVVLLPVDLIELRPHL